MLLKPIVVKTLGYLEMHNKILLKLKINKGLKSSIVKCTVSKL